MKNILIEQYINKITINDVKNFSNKNGVFLDNNIIELIYKYIKNDYKTILYGNINIIFDELKNKINEDNLNKIKNLYFEYKQKYSNYLS